MTSLGLTGLNRGSWSRTMWHGMVVQFSDVIVFRAASGHYFYEPVVATLYPHVL